jgi:BirA family biotin operon repressor/biotin-[acetyl-CoA-carboxylase] ligase
MSDIIIVEEANSSNTYANNLIKKEKLKEFSIIWVKNQTHGKGQGNRKWHSLPNQNITISMILYPTFLQTNDLFYLSKITAISCHQLINNYCKNVAIKWPNDIYVKNNKIAGILIENIFSKNTIEASIVGIGINVNQTDFPKNIPNPTSLKLETYNEFSLPELIKELQKIFKENYKLLEDKKFNVVDKIYNKYLYLRNKIVNFVTSQGNIFSAKIIQVNPQGEIELLVDNTKKSFKIGNIEMLVPN